MLITALAKRNGTWKDLGVAKLWRGNHCHNHIEMIQGRQNDGFITIETDDFSGNQIIEVAFKEDIEGIPTIKAIPLEKIKEFRNYITKVNDITLIQKLNELIESEGK